MEKEISPILNLQELVGAIYIRAAELENDQAPKVDIPVKVDGYLSWDPVDIAKEEICRK